MGNLQIQNTTQANYNQNKLNIQSDENYYAN